MKPHDLSRKVLDTIKNKAIRPTPKWEFMLKNYAIWTMSIVSLVVGSFAFAVIVYMITNSDWDLYQDLSGSLLGFILASLPYLWLVFLILFIFLAHYNFRHTKTGYKHRFYLILITSIIVSMFLGIFFYTVGLGQAIDDVFADNLPKYHQLFNPRARMWHQAERGFLAGTIISVHSPENFQLRDFEGNLWDIINLKSSPLHEIFLKPNTPVRILGHKIDEHTFEVKDMRPWRPNPAKMLFKGVLPPFSPVR